MLASHSSARCCRSWVLTKGEDDAVCPYCRAPVAEGKWSIGELPAPKTMQEEAPCVDEPVELS